MKYLLLLLFISTSALADYTACWTPPTQNTDNTDLTDLDGYNLWAIPADRTYGAPQVLPAVPPGDCVGRGPADCHFQDTDGRMCYHKFWPSPVGDWKLKMQSFNTAGTTSADSPEIFFELQDLNNDGNPDVVGGADPGPVVVPPPEDTVPDPVVEPDPVVPPIEPPVIEPDPVTQRSNSIAITRTDYYTVTGPDGAPLLKPDGNPRRVTNVIEAIERITQDGRTGTFMIHQPDIRVEYE